MERGIEMKTYRTIDLLNAVYNGKIFENDFKNIKTGEVIHQGENADNYGDIDQSKVFFKQTGGNFVSGKVGTSQDFTHFLEEEWEEVQEPVSFMEAIKIGSNGYKKIRYENWNDYVYVGEVLERLSRKYPKTAYEMMQGKWYIKEDEE
jgi:hypothetical protein